MFGRRPDGRPKVPSEARLNSAGVTPGKQVTGWPTVFRHGRHPVTVVLPRGAPIAARLSRVDTAVQATVVGPFVRGNLMILASRYARRSMTVESPLISR